MDIKTRLEDDKVLFLNSNSENALINMLNSLHNKGIYTVADMINFEEKDFPQSTRKKYVAIANVFRHAYLGLDLVYDVLFEKIYEKNEYGFRECANDLIKMGFDPKTVWVEWELYDYHETQFSMEYILKNCTRVDTKGPGLKSYYIRYIDEKKKKDQEEMSKENIPTTLKELQKQLLFLIDMRDKLDKQIQDISNYINTMDGGQEVHGK